MNRREKLREVEQLERRLYATKSREEQERLLHKMFELECSAYETTEDDDEPIAQKPHELKPSEVTDAYWLCAVRKKGTYHPATANSGKWLIFVPVAQIDEAWAKIKLATEEGRLGSSAKASTAKPNPNATSRDRKVICVYTYDSMDVEDVRRIRQELRALGITWKIAYKEDKDTAAGKYSNRGHKGIAKYYE